MTNVTNDRQFAPVENCPRNGLTSAVNSGVELLDRARSLHSMHYLKDSLIAAMSPGETYIIVDTQSQNEGYSPFVQIHKSHPGAPFATSDSPFPVISSRLPNKISSSMYSEQERKAHEQKIRDLYEYFRGFPLTPKKI